MMGAILQATMPSLPSRERGLKYACPIPALDCPESLPSRERGLKLLTLSVAKLIEFVAPFAGAWIEMLSNGCNFTNGNGRSLRGSVD